MDATESRWVGKQMRWMLVGFLGLMGLALLPDPAAAAVGGGGLPYEAPLTQLRASVTGPVAFTLSLLGIVVAGGVLIFGGELTGVIRSLVILVLVVAILVGANNLLTTLFGAGAEIASFGQGVDSAWSGDHARMTLNGRGDHGVA